MWCRIVRSGLQKGVLLCLSGVTGYTDVVGRSRVGPGQCVMAELKLTRRSQEVVCQVEAAVAATSQRASRATTGAAGDWIEVLLPDSATEEQFQHGVAFKQPGVQDGPSSVARKDAKAQTRLPISAPAVPPPAQAGLARTRRRSYRGRCAGSIYPPTSSGLTPSELTSSGLGPPGLRWGLMFYTVSAFAGDHHALRSTSSPLSTTGQPRAQLDEARVDMVLSTAAPAQLAPRRTWIGPTLPMRAMDASLLPEVHLRAEAETQLALTLASEGVLRYVWHSRHGDMLIEVRGDEAFVNGQRVERHQS